MITVPLSLHALSRETQPPWPRVGRLWLHQFIQCRWRFVLAPQGPVRVTCVPVARAEAATRRTLHQATGLQVTARRLWWAEAGAPGDLRGPAAPPSPLVFCAVSSIIWRNVQAFLADTFATETHVTITYVQRLRLLGRDARLYLAAAALTGFATDGMRGVLVNLYLLRLGYGPEWIGLISAVGALTFGVLGLPAGAWGRRRSSRRSMIVGLGLMAFGSALLPLVESIPLPWRTTWLVLTSILANVGVALFYANNMPFLAGATGILERTHAFSVEMALVSLATFGGALVGGLLPGLFAVLTARTMDSPEPFRLPLLLAAALLVPGMLVLRATSALDVQQPEERAVAAGPTPYVLIGTMVLVAMLRFGGRAAVATFFNVYMDQALHAPASVIGACLAAGQLLAAPVALLAPFVVARWGNSGAIVSGALGMAAFMLSLALVPTWGAAGIGYVGGSALFFLTTGPIRQFTQEVVSPAWRSTMSGAVVAGVGLSMAAMSLGGGYAIRATGFESVFLAGAGLTAAGGVLFWACFRERRREAWHNT